MRRLRRVVCLALLVLGIIAPTVANADPGPTSATGTITNNGGLSDGSTNVLVAVTVAPSACPPVSSTVAPDCTWVSEITVEPSSTGCPTVPDSANQVWEGAEQSGAATDSEQTNLGDDFESLPGENPYFNGPYDLCLYVTNPTVAGDNGILLGSISHSHPKPRADAAVINQGDRLTGSVSMQQTWCYGECSWNLSATEATGHCPAHEAQAIVWRGGNWSGLTASSDKFSIILGPKAVSGLLCFYVTDSAPAVTLFVGGAPYQQSQQEVTAGCAAHAPVKPQTIVFGCRGIKFEAERLKYRSYGSDTATATGLIRRKSCERSCVAKLATITLSDPTSDTRGDISYKTLSWTFRSKPLVGLPQSGKRTIRIGS